MIVETLYSFEKGEDYKLRLVGWQRAGIVMGARPRVVVVIIFNMGERRMITHKWEGMFLVCIYGLEGAKPDAM
ncbi:hypothetical protein QQP08_025984 [Theobroma cacao]|nr:hypothetical protein QQP08_025984 [Theobroma cacao]